MNSKPGKNERIIFLPVYDVNSSEKIYIDSIPQNSISIKPGSEAQIAHWIRNSTLYIDKNNRRTIIDNSSVLFPQIYQILENGEKINFVCIADMSLSGSQVIDFIKSLDKTRKFFQQRLSRKISISLIAFAISSQAESRIDSEVGKFIDSIDFEYYTKSINDIFWWNSQQKLNVINLCQNHQLVIQNQIQHQPKNYPMSKRKYL